LQSRLFGGDINFEKLTFVITTDMRILFKTVELNILANERKKELFLIAVIWKSRTCERDTFGEAFPIMLRAN